jgi:hypothetical protein
MLQSTARAEDTQQLLRPFSLAPVPQTMQYNVPPLDPVQQFLQQQAQQRLRNIPERMLTNDQFLKRFEY